jgi:addiction module HigA family antidote
MSEFQALHPGEYIREKVLPAGLTVTAAAKQLGVGRPALSNMLNGNAALSPDMAVRLEKTFGCDSKKLLRLQAAYDRAEAQAREPAIAVRAYTPSILAIKAMQIEAWADGIDARHEFAALLRRLVYSTGDALTKLDFPAFENAQRHGWDGFLQAQGATPWIPLGESGWEFGVNQNPGQKAEHDYTARTGELPADIRDGLTFVFVTPRQWPGKVAWAAAKTAEKKWKGVRAYDASDLEQWIETSIPAQAFFAEKVPQQDADLLDLNEAWNEWANAAERPLSKALFKAVAPTAALRLKRWLDQEPDRPFTIAADSQAEGVAAIACAFEAGVLEHDHARERVVVVKSRKALAKLMAATSDSIAIIDSAEVQAEAGDIPRRHHTIVVTHRNGVEETADFAVDLIDDETFRTGLGEMGFAHIDVERLDRESGRSLTVLRRRLALLPALRSPPWANDADAARRLVPLMLVGAWDAGSTADQAVVEAMAAQAHDEVEATVAEWVGEADSPLWSIGRMRGVVSKTDAFYAIQRHVTTAHLKRFFEVARVVLAEEDPALDLPEDQKWTAAIYGKTRRHSPAVRRSLCETLVLLSVHGENLFRVRLGFDVVGHVNTLIRELLTPLDGATWQSQQHDLPRYAEAAPDVFLGLLDDDLRSASPKIHALLRPTGSGPFSWPGRTGLLWALEALAWNPVHLSQVVSLLAKLAEIKINDNWANKPEGSLDAIFRCWMPQTAAPIEDRLAALDRLCLRHPAIGWRICLNQFDGRSTFGSHSARPQWRADAAGAGESVTHEEWWRMARHGLDIALAWPAPDEHTLGDLVERLDSIPDQEKVWSAIRTWMATSPSDAAKAGLREQVRRSTMVRPPKQSLEGQPPVAEQARDVFDALEPQDLVWRHQWLFAQHWVQESADELYGDDLDFREREARIERRRQEALTEVWRAQGLEGIRRLCRLGDASIVIGGALAKVLTPGEAQDVLFALAEGPDEPALDQCLTGLLWCIPKDLRDLVYEEARAAGANRLSADGLHHLLLRSPFNAETWARAADVSEEELARYWADVVPRPLFHEADSEVNQATDALLDANRPRAAFATVHMAFKVLTTDRLVRLLNDVATVGTEPSGHYQLSQHDLSEAFSVLSARPEADRDTLARLEFMFIDGLSHTKHGIRNLERQLSESPALFIQALMMVFRRRDGQEDPPELRATDPEAAQKRAHSAYALLSRAKRLPGLDDTGKVDGRKLRDWITATRALAREVGREEIAESQIGQLLAHSPNGSDGVWPHEAVREVLEDLGTDGVANGMMIGRQNERGAVWRGSGGDQERVLVKQYKEGAAAVAAAYPFTARLLNGLARSYDNEAAWHDDRALIEKRLPG